MAKELTHRAEELKELGWSQDDVFRYAELWDYRQRWGAINLERDDRQFLRKAEAALPKVLSNKVSTKKSTQEKSYYLWLSFYLKEMDKLEQACKMDSGARGVWAVLIEEELRLLDYYEPVLGLPDTIKARTLFDLREGIVKKAINSYMEDSLMQKFDFISPIKKLKDEGGNKSWKFLREEKNYSDKNYLILKKDSVSTFRNEVREELLKTIPALLPSLSETEKPLPPDNWSRD